MSSGCKLSKVSARRQTLGDVRLIWRRNVYIPRACKQHNAMQGNVFSVAICLIYDAVHLPLSAGLCRQGKQVQWVWAHKCIIRLSACQTVPLDSDLWLFPPPPPDVQVVKRRSTTPGRIPFHRGRIKAVNGGGRAFILKSRSE